MVQETATQIPSPSEAAPVEAAVEAALDATSPEAEVAPQEETPKAWASVNGTDFEDEYSLYESDLLKDVRERDLARIRDSAKREADLAADERVKKYESEQVNSTLQGFIGRVANQIEIGDIDGAEKVINRLWEFAKPYQAEHEKAVHFKGMIDARDQFRTYLLDAMPDRRAKDSLEDYFRSDSATWEGAMKRVSDSLRKADKDAEYQRGVKEGRAAALEEMKAESRNGVGPDNAPVNSGGSKRYSAMTFEERKALSPAERDALVRQEIGA